MIRDILDTYILKLHMFNDFLIALVKITQHMEFTEEIVYH